MTRLHELVRLHELDRLPEGFAQGIWAKLAQQSELAQMTSSKKIKYIKQMTTEIDKRAQLAYAREEGLKQGHEQGLAEGTEKGRGLEKLETARKMKADGVPAETIAKYTGLTLEQIAEL